MKEVPERVEKRSSSSATTTAAAAAPVNSTAAKQTITSTSSSNSEKETRKDTKDREEREQRNRERDRERESSEKIITIKEKSSSKDSKRDKDDGDGGRKRDRGEKTRDRDRDRKYYSPVSPAYHANDRSTVDGAASPTFSPSSPMYVEHNERFHPDAYDERDRDLSSISNSSKGSNNRRSQDSPDERELVTKRRRIDGSKVNNFQHSINRNRLSCNIIHLEIK